MTASDEDTFERPEQQCEEMVDSNVAWELKDDVMTGRYLLGKGFLQASEEAAIARLLKALEAVDVQSMPSGAGRQPNLAAMTHSSCVPVRVLAAQVLEEPNRHYG